MIKKSRSSVVFKCPQDANKMVKGADGKYTCPKCQGVFAPGSFIGIHCPKCQKPMIKSADGRFVCVKCYGVFTPGSFIGIHS